MNRNNIITSASNSNIKKLVTLLKKPKQRREDGVFVLEGKKMFLEVLEQFPERLKNIYITPQAFDEMNPDIQSKILSKYGDFVDEKVFSQMAETVTPQGVMAIVEMQYSEIDSITSGEKVKLLVLDDLRDPGNMGTIIRTAEAAGVSGILMSKETVDVTNPKVVRSTMGALLRVPLVYTDNLPETLLNIKKKNKDFKIFASALNASIPYREAVFGNSYAIVVGNEANGVSEAVINTADRCVIIPMSGKVESLNAAVAAAILMYADVK